MNIIDVKTQMISWGFDWDFNGEFGRLIHEVNNKTLNGDFKLEGDLSRFVQYWMELTSIR